MDHENDTLPGAAQPSRRNVLIAGAGTAAGVALLAACGGNGNGNGGSDSGNGSGGNGSGVLAKVADVPVGGAVSATDADGKPVIVAQPSKGDIVAFSAICTHRGCTVKPDGGQIMCPCHGSTYDLTGKNTGGPAPSPLPAVTVKVAGGDVVEG